MKQATAEALLVAIVVAFGGWVVYQLVTQPPPVHSTQIKERE